MSEILLLNPSITARMTAMWLPVDPAHARALPLPHRQVLFEVLLEEADLFVDGQGIVCQFLLREWIREAHYLGLHLFMPDGEHFSLALGDPDYR